VDAEHLIALEAAFAELGGLYTAARNFTKLVDRAEADLLPRLTALSARLRGLHRTGGMAQPDIDAASRDIIELRATWQSALEEIRQSQEYAGARDAFQNDDQAALAGLIPRVFAGMTPVEPTARRAECVWSGLAGTGAEIAGALRQWGMTRFEVTEEPSEGNDGERYMHVPGRGLYAANTSASGDIVISEHRLRTVMMDARGPEALAHELHRILGTHWDIELEPYRHAGEGGPPVQRLNRVG